MGRLWTVALLVIGACAIEEDDFPERAANAWCRKASACDEIEARVGSEDFDDCLDFAEDLFSIGTAAASFLNCDYDPAAAGSCVAAFGASDCDVLDDAPEACDEVYPDCAL